MTDSFGSDSIGSDTLIKKMKRNWKFPVALAIVTSCAVAVVVAERPHPIVGRWVSQDQFVDVPAGELEVQLNRNGIGHFIYDKTEYFWFDQFTYRIDGKNLIIEQEDDILFRFEFEIIENELILFVTKESLFLGEPIDGKTVEDRLSNESRIRFGSLRRTRNTSRVAANSSVR